MSEISARAASGMRAVRRTWPRRAADLDQGVAVLLLLGAFLLLVGVLGLFFGLDGLATAAAILSGSALCGLAAVLFASAAPRYVGTASVLARTMFDYTDAKARLAALELPDELREPFRRLARGEAAESYLESVLRSVDSERGNGDAVTNGSDTAPAVDVERLAERAVDRAGGALAPAGSAGTGRRGRAGRDAASISASPSPPGDTLDQALPRP